MDVQQNFIDGRFLAGGGGERIEVLNPARDTVISEIPDTPADMVNEAVASAEAGADRSGRSCRRSSARAICARSRRRSATMPSRSRA